MFFVQISFLIFNDFGLIRWWQLKNTKEKQHTEIKQLLNQQIKLQNEIIKIESNTEYLEKIAREKFMMVKPGEKVFKVINIKNPE